MKILITTLFSLFLIILPITETRAQSKPTLVVVMLEKVMGTFGTTGFEQPNQAEATMMQKFNELGFTVVDPQTVKRNITRQRAKLLLQGDVKAASEVALRHEAEYAVIGNSISKFAGAKLYGTQMQSIQATLTARIIRSDNAQVIGSSSAQAAVAHIDEIVGGSLAIEKAANDLAGKLSRSLVNLTRPTNTENPALLTVNINNLVSYRHLDFLMSYFNEELPGVVSTELKSYSNGLAEIILETKLDSSHIAKSIANKKFQGFRLEPADVSIGRLDLTVVLGG